MSSSVFGQFARKSKICNFGGIVFREENIFRFQIPMENLVLMNILHSPANPLKNKGNLLVLKSTLSLHIIEERPFGSILQNQMDEMAFSNHLIKFDNIPVLQLRVDFDLLFDVFEFFFFEFGFIYLIRFTDFRAKRWRVGGYSTRETVDEYPVPK